MNLIIYQNGLRIITGSLRVKNILLSMLRFGIYINAKSETKFKWFFEIYLGGLILNRNIYRLQQQKLSGLYFENTWSEHSNQFSSW